VIVRPGGLTDDPASGSVALTESTSVAGSISRDDVAALVVKALRSKKADGKVGARVCVSLCACVCVCVCELKGCGSVACSLSGPESGGLILRGSSKSKCP